MIENLRGTYERIKRATEESPIAVFRTDDPKVFRSIFASTVRADQESKLNGYMGTYHGPYGAAEFKRLAAY